MNKNFVKLSNDDMAKLVLSDKHIMFSFLYKTLNRKIDKNFKIVNKKNNKEINPKYVLEYLKQELSSNSVNTKRKKVDFLIKTKDEIIDIEINNTFNEEIRKRNFSYMAIIYSNYLKHSEKYISMPKFTQINICKNISEDYDYDNHCVIGEKYKNKLVDNINFLVINVAKYKNILYTNNEILIKKFAHIIMFDCDKEELELLSKYDEFAKEVKDMVNKYNMEDENMFNFLLDEEDEEKLIKSQLEGERMRGKQQGLKLGIEKTKLQTAKSLLKDNVPLNIIENATGFKPEYLKTIKI